MSYKWPVSAVFALFAMAIGGSGEAAQCGSALLLETAAPAVIAEVDPSLPLATRFWEAGSAGANRSDVGCQTGCVSGTGLLCLGGSDCLALSGVSWLNASCTLAGHLPSRTVFLAEQTTLDMGGRWAAINLDTNPADANTDLDAKATTVCAGCASVLSPYLGGSGWPSVTASSVSLGILTATLTWLPSPSAAQALSNGSELVTSYAVFYRGHLGVPPPSSGDPTGWTLVSDLQPDGVANGGFSTDTQAMVEIQVPAGVEVITFAIGLNFDGSGDPVADPNTVASALLSDQSTPVLASSLIFTDGFESGDTTAWSNVLP